MMSFMDLPSTLRLRVRSVMEVIGIESTLHHPLAPKYLLLHSFKPGLHGSRPLGTLHIADVKHPLPQILVDDVREERVLGGA